MAFDNNLVLAGTAPNTGDTIDISAAITKTYTAVNLGRSGLPEGASLVVVCMTPTTDTTAPPFEFRLELTVDNGSNWKRVGALTTTLQSKGVYVAPVGLVDFATEQYTASDIDVRVVVTWDTGNSASDPVIMAFLTNRIGKFDPDTP